MEKNLVRGCELPLFVAPSSRGLPSANAHSATSVTLAELCTLLSGNILPREIRERKKGGQEKGWREKEENDINFILISVLTFLENDLIGY